MKAVSKNLDLIVLLFLGAILRIYFILLDPYLHPWDERFHALVARNLMDDPLMPLLRSNPIVPFDATSWCCNSVWLHKQPLFMWQMALSMKLFGVSEWAMRLPSMIMGCGMIYFLYRITWLATQDKYKAFIAGLLFCCSQYQLEMTSGFIGMDHNDIAFGFYILASFWMLAEYIEKPTLAKIVWCGALAGMAVLNKWLTGLLVFVPVFMLLAHQYFKGEKRQAVLHLFLCGIAALVVFLPWQIYILTHFHDLAVHEYQYNSQHIWEAVEGHSGSNLFYLNLFDDYFGKRLWIFIPLGFLILLFSSSVKNKKHILAVTLGFILPLLFFSLIAKTKMPSYCFIVVPFGIVFMAISIHTILNMLPWKIVQWLGIFVLVFILLKPLKSKEERINNPTRNKALYNTAIYKNLHHLIPNYINTVINVNSFEDVDVMFYNKDITAYHWWIDVSKLDSLKNKKVWIAAFKNHGEYVLPSEYQTYPYLFTIDTLLQ